MGEGSILPGFWDTMSHGFLEISGTTGCPRIFVTCCEDSVRAKRAPTVFVSEPTARVKVNVLSVCADRSRRRVLKASRDWAATGPRVRR